MFQSISFVDSPAVESTPKSGSFLYVRDTASSCSYQLISIQFHSYPTSPAPPLQMPLHLFWDRQLWMRRCARHNDPTVQGVEVGLHGLGPGAIRWPKNRPQPAEMRRSPCAGSVTWHKMALNQLDLENYGSTWVKRLGKPSNGLLYFKHISKKKSKNHY